MIFRQTDRSKLSNAIVGRDLIRQLHQLAIGLLLFSLSFPPRFIILSINAFIITFVIDVIANRRSIKFTFKGNAAFIALLLLFVTFLFSTFLSSDTQSGFRIIERRLLFLVVSLWGVLGYHRTVNHALAYKALILGVIGSLFYLAVQIIYKIGFVEGSKALYQLDPFLFIQEVAINFKHRTYWGIVATMSIVAVVKLYISKGDSKWLNQISALIPILVMLFYILASDGRGVIISIVLLVSYWGIFYLYSRPSKTMALGGAVFIIGFILLLYFFLPRFNALFSTDSFSALFESSNRGRIWSSIFPLVKDNYLWGIGIGDVQDSIFGRYNQIGYADGIAMNYNPHNGYLQSVLEGGIIQLLLFIVVLAAAFWSKNGSRKFNLPLSFAIILLANSLFEVLQNRIEGVAIISGYLILISDINLGNRVSKSWSKLILSLSVVILLFIGIFLIARPKYNSSEPESWQYNPYKEVAVGDYGECSLSSELKGSLLDAETTGFYMYGNMYSHTRLFYGIVQNGMRVGANVLCYVSEDFNGDRVRITVGENNRAGAITSYDFSRKGQWQTLNIDYVFKNGNGFIMLEMTDDNSNNDSFKDLKGFVIFAKPEFNILKK